MAFARAVQGSNSIEGYNASLDDVVAAVDGEPTLDAEEETQLALAGYRDAMTYVLQIADDDGLDVDEGLLKRPRGRRDSESYYAVLEDVGAGAWHPERDTRPWVRFCMRAHYLQAVTTMRRREEIESLWNSCVQLTEAHHLPERCAAGLMDAAIGLRIRRQTYRSSAAAAVGEELSDLTASRDLKAMVDSALLVAVGERRARTTLPATSSPACRGRSVRCAAQAPTMIPSE